MGFFDGNIEDRISAAKELARRVSSNEHETIEEATLGLQVAISRFYGIPVFSDYFKERTLDEMVFELEIINISSKPQSQRTSETLSSNKEEASALFDDWAAADLSMSDEEFNKEAEKFMKTGDFKE